MPWGCGARTSAAAVAEPAAVLTALDALACVWPRRARGLRGSPGWLRCSAAAAPRIRTEPLPPRVCERRAPGGRKLEGDNWRHSQRGDTRRQPKKGTIDTMQGTIATPTVHMREHRVERAYFNASGRFRDEGGASDSQRTHTRAAPHLAAAQPLQGLSACPSGRPPPRRCRAQGLSLRPQTQ